MIVWRFSQHDSLDGRGGLLASARWHTRGKEILHCAPNPATAVLEILVHNQVREPAAMARIWTWLFKIGERRIGKLGPSAMCGCPILVQRRPVTANPLWGHEWGHLRKL